MDLVLFIGILLVLGLASTRLMKLLKLPNVTGYLIIGLLAAIVCILIDNKTHSTLTNDLDSLNSFVSTIALGFIALSIGEEFKLSKIKEYGTKIISITLFQALLTVLLVDVVLVVVCLLLNINISVALCLGAIAAATAPAATLMVIHQYKAKGPLVDILLPVVAFDDAVGLIVFSISVAVSKVLVNNTPLSFTSICLIPLLEIIGSLILGFALGFLMHIIIKYFHSRNNHTITIIAFTLLGVGLCNVFNTISIQGQSLSFSSLLTCMMIGACYINIGKSEEKNIVYRDFDLIDHWTPFLFMLFFVLSGTHLATSAHKILVEGSISLTIVIIIFVSYILSRSFGKYFGAFIGCKATKQSKEVTNYLGITLLPQAGVAIGMANQIAGISDFQVNDIGNIIITVVLCATLLYELVGPLLTKWSLQKTNEIPKL